jgi:beta-glucosidase
VLTGAYNPGGRLPVTVVYQAGQIPLYYNHPNGSAWNQGGSIGFADYMDLPHRPRYCFGHGLSYTQFEYGNLTLSAAEIMPAESIFVTAEIRNTGSQPGDEVVQLYISDRYAGCTRPVQELAGFLRVHLEPGETKPSGSPSTLPRLPSWTRICAGRSSGETLMSVLELPRRTSGWKVCFG